MSDHGPNIRLTRKMHPNRESWLNAVVEEMRPWFVALGCPLPAVRVAIGFPSKGIRSKAMGECWSSQCSGDQVCEIFITPKLDDVVRIAGALAHELGHAAVGIAEKHGPKFRRVVRAIGLEGNLTATTEGPRFIEAVAPILRKVGPLPHTKLVASMSSGKPKQSTRMIKCACSVCGYTVRTTAKWLDAAGAPICPADETQMDVVSGDCNDAGKLAA